MLIASQLPGLKTTESLVRESAQAARPLYDALARQLGKQLQDCETAEDLDKLAMPTDFLLGLGAGLYAGSGLAADAGRKETRRRRKALVAAGLSTPTLENYSGSTIDLDFFRMRSFTIAHVDNVQILAKLKDALGQILSGGGSITDFRQQVYDLLGTQLTDAHIDAVIGTNLHYSYNAGKWLEGMDAREELPYWRWEIIDDGATCDRCLPLAGKVYRKTDPFWLTYYPPIHHRDRCTVTEWDAASLSAEGLTVTSGMPEDKAAVPAKGFDNNPGDMGTALDQLSRIYELVARLPQDYGLGDLPAVAPPKPVKFDLTGGSTGLADSDGRTRTLTADVFNATAADAGMIAETMANPSEIWGWPQKNAFYYLRNFETANGPRTVAVEVWGDIRKVHFTENPAEFRRGMLIERN